MRVVFMGTPEFAVPSLKMLIEEKYEVACVVTQPDKRKGRGGAYAAPPVKELAAGHGIRVFQPVSIREESAFHEISELGADVFVTVAFGGILEKRLLALPGLGCVNVHASLLPKYRGPAPIQWAIVNGDGETGITTMLTDAGIDTGCTLLCDRMTLTEEMYFPEVYDKLANLGAKTLKRTLPLWARGGITPQPQDDSLATRARMIVKEDGRIDFSKSARETVNLIRGLNPWPGTFAVSAGKRIRILRAGVVEESIAGPGAGAATDAGSHASAGAETDARTGTEACAGVEIDAGTPAGAVIGISKDGLIVKCGSGAVSITALQFENGRAMDIGECWHNLKMDSFDGWGE